MSDICTGRNKIYSCRHFEKILCIVHYYLNKMQVYFIPYIRCIRYNLNLLEFWKLKTKLIEKFLKSTRKSYFSCFVFGLVILWCCEWNWGLKSYMQALYHWGIATFPFIVILSILRRYCHNITVTQLDLQIHFKTTY